MRNPKSLKYWTGKATLALLCLAGMAGMAAEAGAATYVASRSVGSGTVSLSITTDDTIGVLSDANIVDFVVTVVNNGESATINSINGDTIISGLALSATATDLLFDFTRNDSSFFLIQATPLLASTSAFLCFQNNGCTSNSSLDLESIGPTGSDGNVTSSARSGLFAIASAVPAVGVVPEPATWAMMIAGFGLVGGSLRRREAVRAIA